MGLDDVPCSTLWTADDNCVVTRLSAVWLAMLDRPVASVLDAPNIWLMTVELSSRLWLPCWAWDQ